MTRRASAVLLYTSGTTSAPKAAILRHRHLLSYVFSSVDFGGAEEADAVAVTVPPYHVAGVANLVSNLYAGRRLVYLDAFSPEVWLETVRKEQVTHAMVVPTMLARIVESLAGQEDAGCVQPPDALLRGVPDRPDHCGPRPRAVPDHRLRQRLRPDRDQFDHRPPRARGPPVGHRERR